ncbi:MAG: sigma-54 interaction domain-containing protein [Desulfobacteria bacterium]|nr:sigma 54-interacting transcriptional regulator [Deltaproteobacteria bacterium]
MNTSYRGSRRGKPDAPDLSRVLESTSVGFLFANCEGKITFINAAAAEKLGAKKEKIIGRSINEFAPGALKDFREIIRTGKPQAGVKIQTAGDTVIADRSPVYDGDRITGVVSVFKELSRYEDTAKELQSYKQMTKEFEAVLNSSYDGLYLTDGNAKTLFFNKSYLRVSGLNEEDVRNRDVHELIIDGTINRSASVEAIKKRKSVTIMQEFSNGRTAIVTGVPVFDEAGNVHRVISNVRDITELNELRAEVQESRTLAERYRNELTIARLGEVHREAMSFRSAAMENCVALATRVSMVTSPVLLTGESGVGKGLLSKLIHQAGNRKVGPFIHVNCGAIPGNLMESELFGYQKGAFTGASEEGKPGLFELADQGTLFLDEIGEVPLQLQVKMLKVLEESEVRRIGAVRTRKIDVRIVAATNRNLKEMIKAGLFREDLFFRLNVFPIHIPSLRERREDIVPLVDRILAELNRKYRKVKRLSPDTLDLLARYPFPGNVRELQNTMERAFILSDGRLIEPVHLPPEIQRRDGPAENGGGAPAADGGGGLEEILGSLERKVLENLWRERRNTYEIAKILKVNQSTVVRKLKKWGISTAQP